MIAATDIYRTPEKRKRSLASRLLLRSRHSFYPQMIWEVYRSSRVALRGAYTRAEWIRSSEAILRCLENVGVRVAAEGMRHIAALDGPAVFVSNHMSTLETFVLPCIIEPLRTCTFVVKEELLAYPVFGPIMRAVEPIAVTRKNPKEDFMTVLAEGEKKIREGFSIIVFPQTTRMTEFHPEEFNTLGIKLALRGGVPVLPVALKSDAWGNGKLVKDFGRIDPAKEVHFAFGPAMPVTGRGADQHKAVVAFIQAHLRAWSA